MHPKNVKKIHIKLLSWPVALSVTEPPTS